MRTPRTTAVLLFAVPLALACAEPVRPLAAPPPHPTVEAARASPPAFAYPRARRGDVVDDLHGTRVADPCRWLEDMVSAESRAWVSAENHLTDAFLSKLPAREALHARLAELYGYATYSLPFRGGRRTFWTQNDGRQNQAVLFMASALDGTPTLVFDPNALSPDGSAQLIAAVAANDGTRVAYGLAAGGGDWQTWHVRDVTNASEPKELPDVLEHIKYYDPAFTHDAKGLYYSRFPAPKPGSELTESDRNCKLYFHQIGTPAKEDAVVYERPDEPTWQFQPTVTRDGRYLVITIGDGEVGDSGQEQIAYLSFAERGAKVVPLIAAYDFEYRFIGNDGPVFFFITTFGAPNKRIIAIDTRAPDRKAWRAVVPEGKNAIDDASIVGRELFVTTLVDAHDAVTAYDLAGKKLRELALPGLGTAYGFEGGPNARETFYLFRSFTAAGDVYRYDLTTGSSALWKSPRPPFDPGALETQQVFYPSKDGTKVPMFLTAKKGTPLDGQSPLILTAYGFGGVPMTPYFDPSVIAWVERGGRFALANIRGGGEYGEAWHLAAKREKKQVGLDDFLAAAEWLIANGYTSRSKLGIIGTSGGGMLVGAATVQRPDLFGASVPIAGVHDLLRFQLFGEGAGWQGDLGSPDDARDFAALYAYSPLHNVRGGVRYPPMLVITSDHDVRVPPLHSYKFAAALQAAQAGPAPVLLRVQANSGHGGSRNRTQRIEQKTEIFTFLAHALETDSTQRESLP